MPRLFIIAGCNGSGKTTASYALLPGMLGCSEYVNSDEFAKSLSPFKPEAAYVAASRYMLMKMRYLLGKKVDFCIETTLATRFLLKFIQEAKQEGYYVTILYFWINSPDLAVARVKARVAAGGHNIKEDTIRRRYSVGLHYLFRDFMPICDRWLLMDNTEPPFTIVAEASSDGTIIHDPEKFSKIQAVNEEFEKFLAAEKKKNKI